MAKTFIIRNFPEDLHRDAKLAAVFQGITLREFILAAIERAVKQAKEG